MVQLYTTPFSYRVLPMVLLMVFKVVLPMVLRSKFLV
jgi:hypothetical protein